MKIVRQPAAWPQSMSRQRSPTIQLCARSMPSSLRRAQQHARLRLAAVAFRRALAGMITDLHAVNRQPPAHFGVNGFHDFLLERAATHVRLVGRHNEQKTGCLEFRARGGNLGKNFKFSQVSRRIGLGFALQSPVDDAVAVKKNGAGAALMIWVCWQTCWR